MAYVYNETRHHIGLPVIRRVSTHHREANSYRLYANLLGPAYAAAVQLSLIQVDHLDFTRVRPAI
jgi:hypothetical protein